MVNTNLTIALVFAALFGAAITWLAVHYLRQWIYNQCVDLYRWLLLLIHLSDAEPANADYGHEKGSNEMHRRSSSRSKRRSKWKKDKERDGERERRHGKDSSEREHVRERSKDARQTGRDEERSRSDLDRDRERKRERERSGSDTERQQDRERSKTDRGNDEDRIQSISPTRKRSRRDRPRESPRRRDAEQDDEIQVAPRSRQRPRHATRSQGYEASSETAMSSDMSMPPPTPAVMQRKPRAFPMPIATAAPPLPQMPQAAFTPPFMQSYVEGYQNPYAYEPEPVPYAQAQQYEEVEEIPRAPRNQGPTRIDFIHICDEYPHIVLEALEQEASSSSSESGDSAPGEQIPQGYIPSSVFQYPYDPYFTNRICNIAPTSHPRQFGRSGRETGPARYAPAPRRRDTQRRMAPSNAPP
ncbi:hypothetical protein P280DRAFT_209892 [Massarina eburnea CBS 473.64]|uniref:Uncharacterized protein n=1 Tax=Massarina eburnea CBS 473.64 TaxID=1395130 RepID=A0A6A6RL51_9PLEO|nr:hypothetical protein P280DRAFT_209892 [Massarina eburnea CBS 473.64]